MCDILCAMEKEPILSPETIAALVGEVGNKIGTRTSEERTLLFEVFQRVLCEAYPLEAYQAIAHLTDSSVSEKQIMTLVLAPDKTGLSDEQQDEVAAAALLYGMFKATKELTASEEIINAAAVFEWFAELVAKRTTQKGLSDPMYEFGKKAFRILADLAV